MITIILACHHQTNRMIPSLRIRHFGKTMTTEKAALTNAQLYFKKGKRLVLPVIVSCSRCGSDVRSDPSLTPSPLQAMLYSGNYLMFIRSEAQINKLMGRVDKELERYKDDVGE